jgi:hypothetical protein
VSHDAPDREPGSTTSMATTTNLVDEVVCPNCWERFRPERSLYVAVHPELHGDRRLGPQAKPRFRSTRFHPDGRAIDPRGGLCHQTACPRCHLVVPRVLLESPVLFVSIFGAPASGKSYFLATMTHQLRQVLPRVFRINFSDADPEANALLHRAEDALFANAGGDRWVSLPKTDVIGDRYQTVDFGGSTVQYPRPAFFQISPAGDHPRGKSAAAVSRVVCLYDNAGESFEAGADRPENPVTQHMARSDFLLFLYDPLQEPAFRGQLRFGAELTEPVSRQDVLLAEAARRIRQYRGLPAAARHPCTLVIAVNKFDVWQSLAGGRRLPDPWTSDAGRLPRLRDDLLRRVSIATRDLLLKHAPTIVTTAESFVEPSGILYMPVSSTGAAPSRKVDGRFEHAAAALEPMWTAVPLIHALARHEPCLFAAAAPEEPEPCPR